MQPRKPPNPKPIESAMQTPDFATLQTFVIVVETGSLSRAAERLDTTTGAVSRRLAALEQRLGLRLLNRTTRKLSLTEAGELYFEDAGNILRALAEAEDRITHLSDSPRGNLRVAAPLSFGVRALAPLLPGFSARYPGLRVSLDLDDRVVDMLATGADLALRIGPLADSTLVARRICDFRRVICAAPDYLARRGEPAVPADLVAHDCLHYSNIALKEEWAFGDSGSEVVSVTGPLCANNGDLLRKAAIGGMGICALPEFIAAEDLAAGRLKSILAGYPGPVLTLWALWPSRRFVPAKVRVLVDYLAESLVPPGSLPDTT
jgi:DNA-binding transcriptional LysR family regulator